MTGWEPRIICDVIILMACYSTVSAVVTIPDSVHGKPVHLRYYSKVANWYQANGQCRAEGGYLVAVDGQESVEKLQKLSSALGKNLGQIVTGVVRKESDRLFYSYDASCGLVNNSTLSWETQDETTWTSDQLCVHAQDGTFLLKRQKCDDSKAFVCQLTGSDYCNFQRTSVSLMSLPVSNASMAVCQATCRQMIGCYATAPSGHATLPPFTHCLFVVTGDDSNPMTTLDCPYKYSEDTQTQAQTVDESSIPKCVPASSVGSGDHRSMMEFIQEANVSVECKQTVIDPSPVVETSYLTLTPEIKTSYVTLTPDVKKAYVTLTPNIETVYVTLTSDIETAYVTLTPKILDTRTTKIMELERTVTVLTSTVHQPVTTTVHQPVTITVHQPVTTTVQQPVTTTVHQPVTTTVHQPVTTTVHQPVTTTVHQPVTTTVHQPITTTVHQPVTTTVQQPVTTTVQEPVTTTVQNVLTSTVNLPCSVADPTDSMRHITTTVQQTISATKTQVVTQTQVVTRRELVTLSIDSTSCLMQPPASMTPNDNSNNDGSGSNNENIFKTEEEVENEMEAVSKELKVNPVNMSRSRRRKESAPDERKSAQTMGAAAVILLTLALFLLMLIDGISLYQSMRCLRVKTVAGNRKTCGDAE